MNFKVEETLKLADDDPMIKQKLKIFFVVSFLNYPKHNNLNENRKALTIEKLREIHEKKPLNESMS